jgi:phage shock protein A
MGIFSRLGTLIKSNINEMISKAEDPEKMLHQVIIEMKKQLVEAKKQVAVAIADEKRIKKQYEEELNKGKDWQRKAMMAVRAQDDNLAREALSRKGEHDESAASLEKQWQMQKQAVDNLKDSLRALNSKIEEAKRKKNILIARQKRAEAQKTIADTMSGLNDTSAFETFDRMSARIDQLEAEAEAGAEMAGELTGDTLDNKFKQLEANTGSDMALAELKAKMGMLPESASQPAAALPEATKADAQVDEALAALKEKVGSGNPE